MSFAAAKQSAPNVASGATVPTRQCSHAITENARSKKKIPVKVNGIAICQVVRVGREK